MPVEAVRLVLRQHDDLEVAGVDEVGEREVDQAVDAAERHRRLGPVGGQRHQPLALAAGEHDRRGPSCDAMAITVMHRTLVSPSTAPRGPTGVLASGAHARRPADAGSTRRRSTAGPASTSPSWSRALRATPTSRCGCAASARRATSPARHRVRRPAELDGRQRRARARSASTCRWPQDCAGADLVHSHTWYAEHGRPPRQAAARHPARRDRAQPRAAAAVEGRAARRRLPRVELDRADGVRGRGRA